jgi:acyl-coenzyme A thioesterase PaaI-like protein
MDDAAFFAVNSLVKDYFALTASFTVYFLRPISTGEMRAVGRVAHRSRRQFIAEAELFDSEGNAIGLGSGTFVRSTVRLGPELGYE